MSRCPLPVVLVAGVLASCHSQDLPDPPLSPSPAAGVFTLDDFQARTDPLLSWEREVLSGIEPTRYSVVRDGASAFLRARADRSASPLARAVDVNPASYPMLSWRWRVERLPEGADLSTKAGDDCGARVYVSFEYEPERASLGERLARSLLSRDLPGTGLCYVWASEESPGFLGPSPYADQVHVIVVESGPKRLGEWVDVERDIAADFRQAFGYEPPSVIGVAVMVDSDQTGGLGVADFDDFVFAEYR